jgi:hypothetical protein
VFGSCPDTGTNAAAGRISTAWHGLGTRVHTQSGTSGSLRTRRTVARSGRPKPHCCHKVSEETRKKIGDTLRGRSLTPEQRATHLERMRDPKVRTKISAAKTGRKRKPFSDEHRRKMSDAKRGRPGSDRGRPKTPEHRAAISVALKWHWQKEPKPGAVLPS